VQGVTHEPWAGNGGDEELGSAAEENEKRRLEKSDEEQRIKLERTWYLGQR
jgi:hypothetical protein